MQTKNSNFIANWMVHWFAKKRATTLIAYAITATLMIGAVGSSIITSYVNGMEISTLLSGQAENMVSIFGENSRLPMMTGSPIDAGAALRNVKAVGSIKKAVIYGKSGEVIWQIGQAEMDVKLEMCDRYSSNPVQKIGENNKFWVFCTPVMKRTDSFGVDAEVSTDSFGVDTKVSNEQEYLGYVVIYQSKDVLTEVRLKILMSTIVVSIATAVLLLFVLIILTRQLSASYWDLYRALHKMRNTKNLDAHEDVLKVGGLILSPPAWPKDFRLMTEAFNEMVKVIFEYKNNLSGMVKAASSDLEIANSGLRRATKELVSFNDSISHDLRTPLATMKGYCIRLKTVLGDNMEPRAQRAMNAIMLSGERMESMIEAMLKLADIEKKIITETEVDISTIAHELLEELAARDVNRRVEYVVEHDMKAKSDNDFVRMLLQNLIGNAWKFTGKKDNAKICVGKIVVDEIEVFYVKDNGAGFKEDSTHELFNAFRRLHSENEFPGIGIGLTNVMRSISRLGGSVWAEGKEDIGAIFYFTFIKTDVSKLREKIEWAEIVE